MSKWRGNWVGPQRTASSPTGRWCIIGIVEVISGLKVYANIFSWVWRAAEWYYVRIRNPPPLRVESPSEIGGLFFADNTNYGDLVEGEARLSRFAYLYFPMEHFLKPAYEFTGGSLRTRYPVGSMPSVEPGIRIGFLYPLDLETFDFIDIPERTILARGHKVPSMFDSRFWPIPILYPASKSHLAEDAVYFRARVADVPPQAALYFRTAVSPLFRRFAGNFYNPYHPSAKSFCLSVCDEDTTIEQRLDRTGLPEAVYGNFFLHAHLTLDAETLTPSTKRRIFTEALSKTFSAGRVPDARDPFYFHHEGPDPFLAAESLRGNVILGQSGDLVQECSGMIASMAGKYQAIRKQIVEFGEKKGLRLDLTCDFLSDFDSQWQFDSRGVLIADDVTRTIHDHKLLEPLWYRLRGEASGH